MIGVQVFVGMYILWVHMHFQMLSHTDDLELIEVRRFNFGYAAPMYYMYLIFE